MARLERLKKILGYCYWGTMVALIKNKRCSFVEKQQLSEIGNKYGRLTIISIAESRAKRNIAHYITICDCGKFYIAQGIDLKTGNTSSCGCYRHEQTSFNKKNEKHFNWQGGISKQKYPSFWRYRIKPSIRKRDNFQCVSCGVLQNGSLLPVHHIDYNKNNINNNNLVTVCSKCHGLSNFNQLQWQEYFQLYINNPGHDGGVYYD